MGFCDPKAGMLTLFPSYHLHLSIDVELLVIMG